MEKTGHLLEDREPYTQSGARMFATEVIALLEKSKSGKSGLIFHLRGTQIAGVVREILADAVVVANQEYSRILIRLDDIMAVASH